MKRIYISDAVHEHLKTEAKRDGRTLQWVVEHKLTGEIPPSPKNTEAKTPENKIEVSDLISNPGFKPLPEPVIPNPLPDAMDILASNAEQDCCSHPTRPCKHWIWDADRGEGYKNVLSGRFREAD